jgi:penicillin-binding protein-related factor A (putative recombinase)
MAGSKGKGWEARLEHWHRAYLKAGRALIVKTEPPVKVNRSGKPFAWKGKGPVDYVGCFEGRPVFFDAKATGGKWTPSKVAKHQSRQLDHAVICGALAFVAVYDSSGMWLHMWESKTRIDITDINGGWADALSATLSD